MFSSLITSESVRRIFTVVLIFLLSISGAKVIKDFASLSKLLVGMNEVELDGTAVAGKLPSRVSGDSAVIGTDFEVGGL